MEETFAVSKRFCTFALSPCMLLFCFLLFIFFSWVVCFFLGEGGSFFVAVLFYFILGMAW